MKDMVQDRNEELCATIEVYWRARGFQGIRTRIETMVSRPPGGREPRILRAVRSNIGPLGYPPREEPQAPSAVASAVPSALGLASPVGNSVDATIEAGVVTAVTINSGGSGY